MSVWGLASLDVDMLRLVISLWVLVMCAALLTGWSIRRQVGTGGRVAAGMVSGLANGAAVGGLPIALFLAAQNIRGHRVPGDDDLLSVRHRPGGAAHAGPQRADLDGHVRSLPGCLFRCWDWACGWAASGSSRQRRKTSAAWRSRCWRSWRLLGLMKSVV
jgi:hypothetical protein